MIEENLIDAFDGAKGVKWHPERLDLVAIWNGGHGVRVYSVGSEDDILTELTIYNIGDYENNPEDITYEEFSASVVEILYAVSEDY